MNWLRCLAVDFAAAEVPRRRADIAKWWIIVTLFWEMDVGVGETIKLLTNGELWRWAREEERDGAPDVCDL